MDNPELTTLRFRTTAATTFDAAGLGAQRIAECLSHQNLSLTMGTCMSKQSGSRRSPDLMQEHLKLLRWMGGVFARFLTPRKRETP